MVDPAIVKEWLDKAEEDFEFAKINLEADSTFFSQICFHFQQAAEKFLKAFIIARELEFKKTHDLEELLSICGRKSKALTMLEEDCRQLTGHYIESRYPMHPATDISAEEAAQAKAAAGRIREIIKKLLS